MKRLVLLLSALVFAAPLAVATPSLGVATGMHCTYAYMGSSAPASNEYFNYFADTFIPAIGDAHGFVVGPSGSSLYVFTSYNPTQTGREIYLMANTHGDSQTNLDLYFGTNGDAASKLSLETGWGQIDGYTNPSSEYYKLRLPNFTGTGGWNQITDGAPYLETSQTWWLYSAPIYYTGTLSLQDYFFAYTRYDDDGRIRDDFSPKTSSAIGNYTQVPEPGSMLLLGSGLIGFLGYRRFKA